MNSNPTPKQEFLESESARKDHNKMVSSAVFQRAIKTALAQHTRVMCEIAPSTMDSPNQLQASAMCFQRVQGANDFVAILLNLANVPVISKRPDTDNLK